MRIVIPVLALAVGAIIYLAPAPKKDVCLASFSTSLEGRTPSQWRNAELAMKKLRGAVIKPGEVFSFNQRVGTWSRDQGYKRAPVSYNGTLIATWGGGVCQTSTTMYNTALLAGMEVVERSSHRFAPDYVAPGRDAAVAFSDIDLKFKNPLPYPVHIDGKIENSQITLSIWGEKQIEEKPQIVTEIHSIDEPHTYHMKGDGGTYYIRNTGKPGCEVWTYRVMKGQRELLSMDDYPVMNKIVPEGE
jgi:vancomycin resistance protein YoaR